MVASSLSASPYHLTPRKEREENREGVRVGRNEEFSRQLAACLFFFSRSRQVYRPSTTVAVPGRTRSKGYGSSS